MGFPSSWIRYLTSTTTRKIAVPPLMVYGSLRCMDLQAVIYDSHNQEGYFVFHSGLCLRDCCGLLYSLCKKFYINIPTFFFIINDTDKKAKLLFSKEEWQEIYSTDVKKKPKVEHSLTELLKKIHT